MNTSELLDQEIAGFEVNNDFTEAVLVLRDGTRLCFCHRVGERWAKSVGRSQEEHLDGRATDFLQLVRLFRLNAKHLDIEFQDGSRWERLPDS